MLYSIHNGTVSQGGEVILSHFDFEIRGTEKIAIVGRNGAGKTTLLSLIAGRLDLDADEKHPDAGISRARKFTIGVLDQSAVQRPEETVEERFGDETSFDRMFTELGFSLSDKDKALGEFSGGEQTKIMLIGLFLAAPDVLVLDEPTNHLDLETTQWLEEKLRAYSGAVVLVSHDRYFIDRVAEVVYEVTGGKLVRYVGNYSHYRQEKAERYARQLTAYEAQQQEIRRLNDLIERFKHKPKKAAFARSRVKILERMEKIPMPEKDDAVIHTGDILPARMGSRNVFEAEHLSIGYEKPMREVSVRIRRGQKIGIFGPNGTGKTTFLRTVAGLIPPLKGKLRLGEHVDAVYFDQFSAAIESTEIVFDWFHNKFPKLTGEEVRSYLAGFLFYAKDFGKQVSNLSGGEKARLVLATLLFQKPNFLILDEPTNNMDIPAKETMESIFRDYRGTILFVSHDRYFLSRVADGLLFFNKGEAPVMYYPFGYDRYMERQRRIDAGVDVSIERTAEEQRLIEGLRSVPEREKRERPLSTAEASIDWELRLNAEEMAAAAAAYEQADLAAHCYPETEEEYENFDEIRGKQQAVANAAADAWTKTLLDWYDIVSRRE